MSTNKKHLAFIASHPGYNLFNRKSAIDSILCSVLTALKDDFHITVNGIPFDDLYRNFLNSKEQYTQKTNTLSTTIRLKKWIPFGWKERLKIRYQKKFNDHLMTVFDNNQPDLIFELLMRGSDLGVRLSNKLDVPLVIYYDSPIVDQYIEIFKRNPFSLFKRNEIKSLQRADKIVVYSQPVADFIMKYAGITNRSKFAKFQTLDYTRLNENNNFRKQENKSSIEIGYIGSFMPWHRVDLLIKAFIQMRDQGKRVKLCLVGAGAVFDNCKTLIQNLDRWQEDILMTGFIDGTELELAKQKIDIGVMPGSNWYGIPTKVFEYGAYSIASIAPSTPTISDIFKDREDILLFENNNYESLLNALNTLVENQELRQSISIALNRKIRNEYNLENVKKFYVDLFNENLS